MAGKQRELEWFSYTVAVGRQEYTVIEDNQGERILSLKGWMPRQNIEQIMKAFKAGYMVGLNRRYER
jgi:thioredoxin-related protein